METPGYVLLLSSDPVRVQDWRSALADTGVRFLMATDLGQHDLPRPDLVVSDVSNLQHDPTFLKSRVDRDQMGVISIGVETSADISLPADCSDRELRIACKLLAEVVRLRRAQTSLLQRQTELSQLAFCDPLTQLPNRRAWDEQFPERAKTACQQQQPLCLALLDLDHFKQLNDRFGHRAGDRVLQRAGQTLAQHSTSARDLLARLGGDEFAWLISGVPAGDALELVESVRAGLSPTTKPDEFITASAGLACVEAVRMTALDDLFDAADHALQNAKSQGRNRTVTTAAG